MREFHLHTHQNGDLHQAVLVSVTRHEEESLLQIHEICIVTHRGNTESKVRLNMEGLTDIMAVQPYGNIGDEWMPKVRDIFYEMLDEESKKEFDLQQFMGNIQGLDETEQMIVASEVAVTAHPINQSIEEIVNERLQNPTYKK